MVKPRQVQWVVEKHVLKYLQGIVGYVLKYLGGDGVKLQGYSDSYLVGSDTNRKSTSGCCFSSELVVISWFNRKQNLVALSSPEVEYMASSLASFEAIWLHKFTVGLFDQEMKPTMIHCQSCIKIS